eukprot:15334478-Ditylum_brightwellii.AAC.1
MEGNNIDIPGTILGEQEAIMNHSMTMGKSVLHVPIERSNAGSNKGSLTPAKSHAEWLTSEM